MLLRQPAFPAYLTTRLLARVWLLAVPNLFYCKNNNNNNHNHKAARTFPDKNKNDTPSLSLINLYNSDNIYKISIMTINNREN
jgi:hypothetical protein